MPPDDLDIEEIEDRGNTIVTDDAGGSKEPETPATAAPSTAKDVSNQVPDDDPYAIIKDVVDKRKKDPAASSATVEDGTAPTRERQTKPPDNEAFTDVPFNKHPRFQEVLRQRNDFKVNADRYSNVQNFLDTQGLSAEEAADMLIIGGLMKVNPLEAWKRMQPTLKKLLVAAGEVLPDDLNGLVKEGKMAPEAALEVSRSRAAMQAVEFQRSFDQQQADRRSQSEQRRVRMDAAQSWEDDRRRRDPNFDAKLPDILKEVVWLQNQEGMPATPALVQDQLRRAYETINKNRPGGHAPARRPAVTPVNGGQIAGDARPAPKNTMEIIQAELAKRSAQ